MAPRLRVGEFFGENRKSFERDGLVLSETRYPPALKVPLHAHEQPYFCLLVGGGYWEAYGRRRVTYDAASVVFHPPVDAHHGDIGDCGGLCFHVEMGPAWAAKAREHGALPDDAVDRHGGELVWLASRLYREFTSSGMGSPLVVEGLVLEMLGELVRARGELSGGVPSWLHRAVERMRAEFSSPLTVTALADDLGVSATRLSRAFRRFHRRSIGEHLQRLRVDHAMERLSSDDVIGLAALALECGFSDQSHFNRVFRKLTGLTPGAFRRRNGRTDVG